MRMVTGAAEMHTPSIASPMNTPPFAKCTAVEKHRRPTVGVSGSGAGVDSLREQDSAEA